MATAGLIICEKTQRWAVALRAALRGGERSEGIAETRALSQAEAAWRESPAAVLAIEVTAANLPAAVELLLKVGRQPQSAAIVLLDDEAAAAEAMLREAGAVGVCRTALDAPAAARLIRRHWQQFPTIAADPAGDISTRLPWPEYALPAG